MYSLHISAILFNSSGLTWPSQVKMKQNTSEFHIRGWWCLSAHWRCLWHVAGSQAGHSLLSVGRGWGSGQPPLSSPMSALTETSTQMLPKPRVCWTLEQLVLWKTGVSIWSYSNNCYFILYPWYWCFCQLLSLAVSGVAKMPDRLIE